LEVWRSIDLGKAEPLMAQTFYEAVGYLVDAGLSPNTIILCQPSAPYVCIGFHQRLEDEIDVEYCHSRGFPIIRRSQGGGATYLDGNQVFYQVVARKESKVVPLKIEKIFERFLAVTVFVYRRLGLAAEFRALNDVVVHGRKISGNGAGDFGENTMILVGNIIMDLDYESMIRILKVPSEKFRDKTAKSIHEWVTSLKRELGYLPETELIKNLLTEGYEKVLGIELVPSQPSEDEKAVWRDRVRPRHISEEWIHLSDLTDKRPTADRSVKIAADVKIVEVTHRAKKLIRISAQILGDKILDISITGDFFLTPVDAVSKIESSLRNVLLSHDRILRTIRDCFEDEEIQSPGINPEDFAEAVMKLKELAET